jgi:hypothetical protein
VSSLSRETCIHKWQTCLVSLAWPRFKISFFKIDLYLSELLRLILPQCKFRLTIYMPYFYYVKTPLSRRLKKIQLAIWKINMHVTEENTSNWESNNESQTMQLNESQRHIQVEVSFLVALRRSCHEAESSGPRSSVQRRWPPQLISAAPTGCTPRRSSWHSTPLCHRSGCCWRRRETGKEIKT